MEPTREAAARLVARGELNVLQKGQIVDVVSVRGPIRLQLSGGVPKEAEADPSNLKKRRL